LPLVTKKINEVIALNLLFATFLPQSGYLSILNMGDGTGLLAWRSFVFSGRAVFLLKN